MPQNQNSPTLYRIELLDTPLVFACLKMTTSEEWIENLLVGPLHNVTKRLQTLEKQRSSESDAAVWDEIPVLIETGDQVFDLYFEIFEKVKLAWVQ